MGAPAAGHLRDVPIEEGDGAAVRAELAGDEVEQRRLARAIRADDEPALPRLNAQAHVGGDAEAAEPLLEPANGQRAHRPRTRRASRTAPGTSPSGMNTTMATKMAPRTKFQRSM